MQSPEQLVITRGRVSLIAALFSAFFLTWCARAEVMDLSHAVIVTGTHLSTPERKAVQMLQEEIARRTQLRLPQTNNFEIRDRPMIALGTVAGLKRSMEERGIALPQQIGLQEAEGFSILTQSNGAVQVVVVLGNSPRAVVFGAGRLLRELRMSRQKLFIADSLKINTAPRMKLRGHQLGYRPKTNSYDGWDVPTWEQYIRDLVVFGCNAIELIPPRSDDETDSPHFHLPQMEMMIEMSRLASDYGLEVWIWYPAMDQDYSNPKTVEFALREWAEVFRKLPRVDAVFVPGGDPGHTRPKYLLELLQKQTANLHRFHPAAGMWVSPQSFGTQWLDEFYELMKAEPAWLSGVVYGPQVRVPMASLRGHLPARYPLRDYPDITHSRHCQFPVPDWDVAFASTEGRETINPRPRQMAHIFRTTTLSSAAGFITYSEGCNDDVNKVIWSGLGWDPEADIRMLLQEYARYFISAKHEEEFADGLLALEQNWNGAVLTNGGIEATLTTFRKLEQSATPQEKSNWRFQQALYRAYYDAYIRRRLTNETVLEEAALRALHSAGDSEERMREAEAQLDKSNVPAAPELRARLFELAEALFQSIRMQLSVERYAGMRGRGNNLDDIDVPLNNRAWLRQQFARIRMIEEEPERLLALEAIVSWTNPGPGGYYDDLGNPSKQPHLVRGRGWADDPGFYATAQVGFTDRSAGTLQYPASWWTSAEPLYDQPVRMRYTDLDRSARYKLRVVYGRYRNNAPVRLLANGEVEIHPYMNRMGVPLEFDIPAGATAGGELNLAWMPTPGLGGNGRTLEVAEVWLIKK